MHREPTLSVEGISVPWGQRCAVRRLTTAVPPGGSLALMGPNGSGKTTALRAMAGLSPVSTGTVHYGGSALSGLSAVERASFRSVLFEDELMGFDATAAEVVTMGLAGAGLHRERRQARVLDALGCFGLVPAAAMAWSRLSQGERRRTLLARCVASGPRLLLLDEPLKHLDLAGRTAFHGMLQLCCSSGSAVVYSTHDVDSALWADEVLVLEGGAVRGSGTPHDVLTPEFLSDVFSGNSGGAPLASGRRQVFGRRASSVPVSHRRRSAPA